MSTAVYVRKSNQQPIEPTPSDPLANIDNALISGGKDKFVSPAEVRSAGQRFALTPSPHRNTKHIGPNEWVHVSPEGGSTGRGSRVTGEDSPTPDMQVDDNYSLPNPQANIHNGELSDADSLTRADTSDDGNAYALALRGYDFAHPHAARAATEGFLRYLINSKKEHEAYLLRTQAHSDNRLSLYPWEIAHATDGKQWMIDHLSNFIGTPSPAAEAEGMAKAHVRTSIYLHGIHLPKREYEVDPVELAERIKRRKEHERAQRKKYHFRYKRFRISSLWRPKKLKISSIYKAGVKQRQDVAPMHVYKQRDGRGYRNVRVVPIGSLHGAEARQEFPDPSWRLDANGHISFSSRDFKRHPRHSQTILPLDNKEHGRQNVHMLKQMANHARATADREGDTNGFWDRLPTAEEVPFYPDDKGDHDIEAYEQIRHTQHHAEAAARKNKIHSPAAESWRDYAQTVARAIETNTGEHPEYHLLASDVERIATLREMAESLGKELESHAKMHTFPQPGVGFQLRTDRTALPTRYQQALDEADNSMAENAEAIGRLFKSNKVHDVREEDGAKNQRRAWLQLAEDFRNAIRARHPDMVQMSPVATTWTDSAKKGSASPFFLLSQSELTTNFTHLITERKKQTLQRQLAMTFAKYAKNVLPSLNQELPDNLASMKLMDYLDTRLLPTLSLSLQQLPLVLREGIITPQTIKDASGISHDSIIDEENRGGLNEGIFLQDGEPYGTPDVLFVFSPRVYDNEGAICFSSNDITSNSSYLDLKHRAYRCERTNRAMVHLSQEIEPIVTAERWEDILSGQFTMLRTQITVIPRLIPFSQIRFCLLHPQTPDDIVTAMKRIASQNNHLIQIISADYRQMLVKQ